MAATVEFLLVDPGCIPNGIAQGSATAAGATHEGLAGAIATRDKRSEVKFRSQVKFKFCFQSRGGTLVLDTDTGCLEIPNPYGVRPIKLCAEVLSTHYQFVLIRIRGSPTGFFVYSFPCMDNAQVIELPNVAHRIWSSRSFGILRDNKQMDQCVVANLEIGRNEAFLDRWHSSWSRSSRSWLRETVTLPLPVININKKVKWKTDKVIPCWNFIFKRSCFSDALLFVDLNQGSVMVCHNVLNLKEKGAAKLEFIPLPYSNVRRMPGRRQETFMSVGYCNIKLKFVSLYISDVNEVDVTIMTFDEWSWRHTSSFTLEFGAMHIPCFPVVSANEDNILYLVLASEDREQEAWLVEVNIHKPERFRKAKYPGFWKHLKPPYSINRF